MYSSVSQWQQSTSNQPPADHFATKNPLVPVNASWKKFSNSSNSQKLAITVTAGEKITKKNPNDSIFKIYCHCNIFTVLNIFI